MSLTEQERKIIVELEIEKSKQIMKEIPLLENAQLWNTICNRLYYAAFHALSALLISEGHPVSTHQGAVILLHQYYIKTQRLSRECGTFYSQLQRLREESDYNCTYYATKDETIARIEPTRNFINSVLALIKTNEES